MAKQQPIDSQLAATRMALFDEIDALRAGGDPAHAEAVAKQASATMKDVRARLRQLKGGTAKR